MPLNKKDLVMNYKKLAAYGFLYLAFLCIFFDFAYSAWIAVRPLSYIIVIFRSFILWIIYVAVNHLLIRRIISKITIMIFESILFLTLLTLELCYDALWDRVPYS